MLFRKHINGKESLEVGRVTAYGHAEGIETRGQQRGAHEVPPAAFDRVSRWKMKS